MRTMPALGLILVLAIGCKDRGIPQKAIPLGEPGSANFETHEMEQQFASQTDRNNAALKTLRDNWDSETITGAMVDEMQKVIENADPETLDPLLDRIELLGKSAEVYAPDFALWWDERGRNEIGGKTLWRRDLLREAFNVAMTNEDEAHAIALLRDAAATGDPVARVWQLLVDSGHAIERNGGAMLNLTELLADARALIDAGDADAAFFLALFAAEGSNDLVHATPDEMVAWLEMAADDGYAHAARMLADAYGRGRHGLQRDAQKARAWMERAGDDDPKARAAALRASSQNNMKQLALVGKMYANESKGEKWPPLSSERGQLAMEMSAVFPEYLVDPAICVSPAHPDFYDLLDAAKTDPQSGMRDHSYWYLGYAIASEEEGLELVKHLRATIESGEPFPDQFEAPELKTTGIFVLHEGIERVYITDRDDTLSYPVAQSSIPIMIERPGLHDIGLNVLYLDGHVEFHRYPGDFPASEAFINALESLDDLKD